METYVFFIIGVIAGAIIANLLRIFRTTFGTLTIDDSDEIKDMYCIEINDLDALEKKKQVVLRVQRKHTQK